MGIGEGKSDIFVFEDVGLFEFVYVDNFDFLNISVCFIIVCGWKWDGWYIEFFVKVYVLKG